MSLDKEALKQAYRRKQAKLNTAEIFERGQQARNSGEIDEAVEVYQRLRMGLSLRNPADQDPKLAADCQHMIGVAYRQGGNFEKADEELRRALREVRKIGNKLGEGAVLRDLGLSARDQQDLERAKDFLGQSLAVLKETGNLGHIGVTQVKLGLVRVKSGDFTQGMIQLNVGIDQVDKSPDRVFAAIAHFDLAELMVDFKNYGLAIKEAEKSREMLMSLDAPEQFGPRLLKIDAMLSKLKQRQDSEVGK